MPERSGAPGKFNREQYFPEDWHLCTSEFLSLFHRYGYIYRPFVGDSWLSANEKWKLTDTEILKAIACKHPRFYIGCRAGNATRFAVLDIDAKSRYHNKRQLSKLLGVLHAAGLKQSVLYRSSNSGGWHLYIFFDELISAADLRRQLVRLLVLNDFSVAKGMLEVFPHPGNGSAGMGLRLPLQPGFAWLDIQTLGVERERSGLTATEALELFIDDLNGAANSYDDFKSLKTYVQELAARREAATVRGAFRDNVVPIRTEPRVSGGAGEYADLVKGVFKVLPPGLNVDNWYRGRNYHLSGLDGPSQRADAIFCLGHYLFYGDPSRDLPALGYGYEQERDWAIREFLASKHNGYSKDINLGRTDAVEQVGRAAHWLPGHKRGVELQKYSSRCPIAWMRNNASRKIDARKRIQGALDDFKKQQRQFTTVELQEKAGCSRTTLYRHADIWRQDYEDLAAGFFAICTHKYNVVEGAGCSKTMPPSSLATEIMPPGRLAARRVAYEISMRSHRDKKQRCKTSVTSKQAAEQEWLARVTTLLHEQPQQICTKRLKALLVVLVGCLENAPYEENVLYLQPHIAGIRAELQSRDSRPHSVYEDEVFIFRLGR